MLLVLHSGGGGFKIVEFGIAARTDGTGTIVGKLNTRSTLYIRVISKAKAAVHCTGIYELCGLAGRPSWKHLNRKRWVLRAVDGFWYICNGRSLLDGCRCFARSATIIDLPYALPAAWEAYDENVGGFSGDNTVTVSSEFLLAAVDSCKTK